VQAVPRTFDRKASRALLSTGRGIHRRALVSEIDKSGDIARLYGVRFTISGRNNSEILLNGTKIDAIRD